jgi:hypothetical protein
LKHLHQELSRLKLNPEREVSLAVTIRFSGMSRAGSTKKRWQPCMTGGITTTKPSAPVAITSPAATITDRHGLGLISPCSTSRGHPYSSGNRSISLRLAFLLRHELLQKHRPELSEPAALSWGAVGELTVASLIRRVLEAIGFAGSWEGVILIRTPTRLRACAMLRCSSPVDKRWGSKGHGVSRGGSSNCASTRMNASQGKGSYV